MKKEKLFKGTAFVAVLIVAGLLGFTAAKYVSKINDKSSADVASWSFTVNDTDIATSSSFTFNAFQTVLDSDGSEETDVADGTVSSGTSGSFNIDVSNDSEVTAEYLVTLSGATYFITYGSGSDDDDETVENGGITVYEDETYVGSFVNYYSYIDDDFPDVPIEFSTDGENYTTDLSTLSFTGTLAAGESAVDLTVYWRWPFDGDDDVDTQLGIIVSQGYTIKLFVTASVAAWQVD